MVVIIYTILFALLYMIHQTCLIFHDLFILNLMYQMSSHNKNLELKNIIQKVKQTFYTNSVGFRDIFAKKEACNLMQENNVTGLQIRSVVSGTNKTEIDDKICQLSTNNIIPTDRIYIDKKIKIKRCSACGAIKFICSSDYQLELN